MKPLALVLACAALGGCSFFSPSDGGSDAPVVLVSGTSFGMCLGYCITELTVEGRQAVLAYSGWDTNENVPTVRHERTLTPTERAALDRAFDDRAFRRADTVYGCPDCADGGAEWVGTADKRVTFEAGREVADLDAFIGVMRDLRASFPDAPQP